MSSEVVPAFAGLWAMVGGRPAAMGRVTVTSPEEYLPSVYPVTAAATAVIAATALAAAGLHDARGGDSGTVRVDGRHAATAFRSERLFRVGGEPPPSPWDELSGYYRAAAGEWVQLHCNFPHHRAGVVDVLGTADDRDEVEAAIAQWDAQELEDRLAAAGMCASRFRSTGAWSEHAHGRHVRNEPLMTVTPNRASVDADDRRDWVGSTGERPLSGVRVLDLSRVIAGPVCGRTLAALGADVLRVGADHLPVIESVLPDTNLGKRYTHLDLRDPVDRASFDALVDGADVVIDGFRPGALDGRGYGSGDLWDRRPDLVLVDLSAYGVDGPWQGRRGFDSLVQTATGIGWAGMEPVQGHDGAECGQPAGAVVEGLRRERSRTVGAGRLHA
ncbi:MAG: CoA transferase, partial [Actinomycetota bacterium]